MNPISTRGADYVHHNTMSPLDFQTLQWLCTRLFGPTHLWNLLKITTLLFYLTLLVYLAPESNKCHYLEGWHGNNLFRNPYKGDKRFGYSDSFQLLDDEAIGYIRNLTKVITE